MSWVVVTLAVDVAEFANRLAEKRDEIYIVYELNSKYCDKKVLKATDTIFFHKSVHCHKRAGNE